MMFQKNYLKYSSLTLSAIILYWAVISELYVEIPAPTLLLRAVAATVGTAMLAFVCAPLDVHVFWAIIHLSPFLITAKASDPKVDALVVTAYGLLLSLSGDNNPYANLRPII